jgi:glycerol-3-phosphate dehydrogenase
MGGGVDADPGSPSTGSTMSPSPELSSQTRAANLETLAGEEFDLLVIGGGITGAGIARDAMLRGWRVALVERRDFSVGTSSRSSKLIHGGLRYLAQGDVGLVLEAANERRVLRRLVPHLARPTRMVVPVSSRSAYAKISAALWTFDRMARVVKDERNHMLDREETLALEPALRADGLYGAGVYFENLTNDARLVLETLKATAARGAVLANYTAVTQLCTEGGRVVGVLAKDMLTDAEFRVRGKVVVNAAGPWVDEIRLLQGAGERRRLHLTKGIHVIMPRARLPVSNIVVMPAADRRSVFVVPHGDMVYLGTTDTNYRGRYDDPWITADDVVYLLDAASAAFAIEPLTVDDVTGAWAGLRPLLHQEGKQPAEISRKDEIMVGPTGLVSIAGGKLTTYRKMAERVVDMVAERLIELGETLPPRVGDSEHEPLGGGETGQDIEQYTRACQERSPQLAPDVCERLVTLYGSNSEVLIGLMTDEPRLTERCAPEVAVTWAEIAYAVHYEMAQTLEDFMERRAGLFLWDRHNGLGVASDIAREMGEALGWSAMRMQAELSAYVQHVREVKTFRSAEPSDGREAHG